VVVLTSQSEVPTLAPLSSSACGRDAAPEAGFRQVVGASQQFRAAPSGPVPLHSLRKAHEMISGARSSEDTGMPTGTIARLLIDKGFGFIRDEGGIEHFFHRSSVRGAVFELLREGQRVEFTPEESGKGPRAGEVRLIEG
jgi:cold shock protein